MVVLNDCTPALSVLIPVRNYDCTELVERLACAVARGSIHAEIILGDDDSLPAFKQIYRHLQEQGVCRVLEVESNIGAGAMRNLLGEEAKGDFLLYLDADTLPVKEDFLATYLSEAYATTVVVGGFVYPNESEDRDKSLRYKYGRLVEMQAPEERALAPYSHFITMSFLIPRFIKQRIAFDNGRGMGYEDALFGFALQDADIRVVHINNPVLHTLKERNSEFLSTTQRYVRNLYRLRDQFKGRDIRLLMAFQALKRLRLQAIGAALWRNRSLLRYIERRLCSPNPNLKLFSLYKLFYFCHLVEEDKKNQRKKITTQRNEND